MVEKIRLYSSYYKNIFDEFIKVEHSSDFYDLPGIYLIKNDITGNIYIGQSKSVGYRLTVHKTQLRNQRHLYTNRENDLLQKSWDKYGELAFSFWIVEFNNIDKLNERECFWIKYFNCNRLKSGHGFNLTDGGNAPPHGSFNKNRVHLYSPETMVSVSVPADKVEGYLAKGYTYGYANQKAISKRITEARKLHGTDASGMKNKVKLVLNTEIIYVDKKLIEGYLANGWKLAAKKYNRVGRTRESVERSARAKWKAVVQISLADNSIIAEYSSLKEASAATGIGTSYISRMCKNKFKKHKYSFIFQYK